MMESLQQQQVSIWNLESSKKFARIFESHFEKVDTHRKHTVNEKNGQRNRSRGQSILCEQVRLEGMIVLLRRVQRQRENK